MALQIRETPVLHGEDAKKFSEKEKAATQNPVPREEYERALRTYEEIKKKNSAGFQF